MDVATNARPKRAIYEMFEEERRFFSLRKSIFIYANSRRSKVADLVGSLLSCRRCSLPGTERRLDEIDSLKELVTMYLISREDWRHILDRGMMPFHQV
jgi:hypothetical protein